MHRGGERRGGAEHLPSELQLRGERDAAAVKAAYGEVGVPRHEREEHADERSVAEADPRRRGLASAAAVLALLNPLRFVRSRRCRSDSQLVIQPAIVKKGARSNAPGAMLTVVLLCLVARFGYSLNDIFIGRMARQYSRIEVAAFRGTSLGVSMAPWLLLVPAAAWGELFQHSGQLVLTVAVTALANVLQFHAVRYLPFGLRAALMLCTMATCSLLIGWAVLGERLTDVEVGLSVVLLASGAAVALGTHTARDIVVDVPRGAALTLASAVLMACAVSLVQSLARTTHPLLTAWAWEFGSGLILLAPALTLSSSATSVPRHRRVSTIAVAALPTALASGASVLALDFGELGLWGALGGTQILFTAGLGALWHKEALGVRRWMFMLIAALAVAGLALVGP